ncbi:hypothetical protein B0H63DRAFT_48274 [Podospora didyma]|uniref:DUF6546 domain-containing protein n=1 Tax=Podospora didyma TaxID=330526 RepID=A0AAE0U8J3_9PEZI|nr:hypothetical protein B0H63DRAFT_48274 [Podospora didyma]
MSVTSSSTHWHHLAAEIRCVILERLLQDGCSLAGFATVSREWQTIIERHNFARIKLTPSRIADFGSVIHRNNALVRYLWLCLELEEYDCTLCASRDPETWGMSHRDNALIVTAFQDLFSTPGTWEPGGGGNSLMLDISVHSPSDSEHWFKYLTFRPSTPFDDQEEDGAQDDDQSMLAKLDDRQHGWEDGRRASAPCRQLPLVPAVTGVLLRQQTRRRWKPMALANMFSRLPELQVIHYEPWREWEKRTSTKVDGCLVHQSVFESLALSKLKRLVLFENFNQSYLPRESHRDEDLIRIPAPNVGRAVATASLKLEHLSASFMVDADDFLQARQRFWEWPNLNSLALTSQLLTPGESQVDINDMLIAAAAATMRMPKLRTMKIWNGQEGLAILFQYQTARNSRQAVITRRGT